EAQHIGACRLRRRRVVLVEEAVGVERVGPGNAAGVEDAAELADVLLASEADAAGAGIGRGDAVIGRTAGGAGSEGECDEHERELSHAPCFSNANASLTP